MRCCCIDWTLCSAFVLTRMADSAQPFSLQTTAPILSKSFSICKHTLQFSNLLLRFDRKTKHLKKKLCVYVCVCVYKLYQDVHDAMILLARSVACNKEYIWKLLKRAKITHTYTRTLTKCKLIVLSYRVYMHALCRCCCCRNCPTLLHCNNAYENEYFSTIHTNAYLSNIYRHWNRTPLFLMMVLMKRQMPKASTNYDLNWNSLMFVT